MSERSESEVTGHSTKARNMVCTSWKDRGNRLSRAWERGSVGAWEEGRKGAKSGCKEWVRKDIRRGRKESKK